jgi:hypothetical protein
MRFLMLLLLASLVSCDTGSRQGGPAKPTEQNKPFGKVAPILAPLIDPAKLDTLKGKRAATPRLRKACYWLEMARRDGAELEKLISEAHKATGNNSPEREAAQSASLIRNVVILERLGCLDAAGMDKLRRGLAPTITKGPYAGEIATGDHIIPRSVTPELDNCLFNLEFMPLTLNQRKSAKVGQRQIQLARRWHKLGILSEAGLKAVEARYK